MQNVFEQLGAIDTWMDQLPSAAHLKLEASRLQHVIGLDTTGSSSLLLLAEESAYFQQLKSLMGTLEKADADDGEIYDILQRVTTVNNEAYSGSPKIVKELELAWNMDQLAILEARASVLDKVQFIEKLCSIIVFTFLCYLSSVGLFPGSPIYPSSSPKIAYSPCRTTICDR